MRFKIGGPIALMSVFAICLGACAAETDETGDAQGEPSADNAAVDEAAAPSDSAPTGTTQEAKDPLIVAPYGYGYGYGSPYGYGYGYPGGCVVGPFGYQCASGYSTSYAYGTGYGLGYPYGAYAYPGLGYGYP